MVPWIIILGDMLGRLTLNPDAWRRNTMTLNTAKREGDIDIKVNAFQVE